MSEEGKFDLMVISLGVDMTDDEIKECIQKMLPVCIVNNRAFCLTIGGYDDDRRELWEIPESIAFMKRLYNLGFIAVLEVSTRCKHLISKAYQSIDELPGFGALEIWMGATGRMETGRSSISSQELDEFMECLEVANNKARQICKEPPYKTKISQEIESSIENYRAAQTVPDGNVRHSSPANKCKLPKWVK